MRRRLAADLAAWERGELRVEDVAARHPGRGAEALAETHTWVAFLASEAVEEPGPTWDSVAARLGEQVPAAKPSRSLPVRRSLAAFLTGSAVLIPATAMAAEQHGVAGLAQRLTRGASRIFLAEAVPAPAAGGDERPVRSAVANALALPPPRISGVSPVQLAEAEPAPTDTSADAPAPTPMAAPAPGPLGAPVATDPPRASGDPVADQPGNDSTTSAPAPARSERRAPSGFAAPKAPPAHSHAPPASSDRSGNGAVAAGSAGKAVTLGRPVPPTPSGLGGQTPPGLSGRPGRSPEATGDPAPAPPVSPGAPAPGNGKGNGRGRKG